MTTHVVTENTTGNRRNSADTYYTGQSGGWMNSASPDVATVTSTLDVRYGSSASRFAGIKFTIPTPPGGETLQSATLELELIATGTGTAQDLLCYRFQDGRDVVFSEMSWNEYKEWNSWTTSGAQSTASDIDSSAIDTVSGLSTVSGTLAQWDVTDDVQDFLDSNKTNNGWLIEFAGTSDFVREFGNATATDGDRPELVLVYASASSGGTLPLINSSGSGLIGT